MENLFFGWTEKQWALAIGHFGRDIKTVKDALKVKADYIKAYRSAPSEEAVIKGVAGRDIRPIDWGVSLKVVKLTCDGVLQ